MRPEDYMFGTDYGTVDSPGLAKQGAVYNRHMYSVSIQAGDDQIDGLDSFFRRWAAEDGGEAKFSWVTSEVQTALAQRRGQKALYGSCATWISWGLTEVGILRSRHGNRIPPIRWPKQVWVAAWQQASPPTVVHYQRPPHAVQSVGVGENRGGLVSLNPRLNAKFFRLDRLVDAVVSVPQPGRTAEVRLVRGSRRRGR